MCFLHNVLAITIAFIYQLSLIYPYFTTTKLQIF